MKETAYLIDGNAEICRAYYSPGPGLTAPDGEPTKATFTFVRVLLRIARERKPDYLALITDPPRKNTWRREFYPEYKANRQKKPPDFRVQFKRCKELAKLMGIPHTQSTHYEADDVIASLTRLHRHKGRDVVIVGRDKDLMQLLNEHVSLYDPLGNTWTTPLLVETRFGVTPNRLRDYLSLVGDTGDNIPGVPGVGGVTALKWLKMLPDGVKPILENPDAAPAYIQQYLSKCHGWANLRLSWKLVGLKKAISDFDPQVLRPFKGIDLAPARAILDQLGFQRIGAFAGPVDKNPLFTRAGINVAGKP